MAKWQTQREWAEALDVGDKLMTNYPDVQHGYRDATVENVVLDAFCQSGILIKLKEFPDELDLFWIRKKYKEDEQGEE